MCGRLALGLGPEELGMFTPLQGTLGQLQKTVWLSKTLSTKITQRSSDRRGFSRDPLPRSPKHVLLWIDGEQVRGFPEKLNLMSANLGLVPAGPIGQVRRYLGEGFSGEHSGYGPAGFWSERIQREYAGRVKWEGGKG